MNGVMLVLLDPLGGSRAPYDHALAWSKAWCGNRGFFIPLIKGAGAGTGEP